MINGLENTILEAMENNSKLASSTSKLIDILKGKVSSYNLYLLKILPEIMEWNLSLLDMIQDVITEDTVQEMDEDEVNKIIDSMLQDLRSYFFGFLNDVKIPEDTLHQLDRIYFANEYMIKKFYLNTLNNEIKDLEENYEQAEIIKDELKELREDKTKTEKFLDAHKDWQL